MGIFVRFIALGMLLLGSLAQAEQAKDFGPYRVHFSAFTSDFLDPQVAQSHDIARSGFRGVLTVTVQKPQGDQPDYKYSVPAFVQATATDPTGRAQPVMLREVREGDVVYYVGTFPIVDRQELIFALDIRPQGAPTPFVLSFGQQFFAPKDG